MKQFQNAEFFDSNWYVSQYPDVALSGLEPIEHFKKIGIHLGRLEEKNAINQDNILLVNNLNNPKILNKINSMPHAASNDPCKFLNIPESNEGLFDQRFYSEAYPDVSESGINLHKHFLSHGIKEGRLPSIRIKYPGKFFQKKETILLYAHEASYSGAPILAWNLCKYFLMDYNVIVIFYGNGGLLGTFSGIGAFEVGPIPPSMSDFILNKITSNLQPKFAIINSIESRHSLAGLANLFIPSIALLHEFSSYTRPKFAFHDCIYNATKTVFSTKATRQSIISRYPELSDCNLLIEPQGKCDIPPPQKNIGINIQEGNVKFASFDHTVIGLGAVQYRKGVDLFIECAKQIIDNNPDLSIQFLWYGSNYDPDNDLGYSCYLEDQILSTGLISNIKILPPISELSTIYSNSSLLLVTSRLDPLPNVAIDAMVCGLPVLCFDLINGVAEHLFNAGVFDDCVSKPYDITNMAIQASDILKGNKKITEKIKNYANKKFRFNIYGEKITEIAVAALHSVKQMQTDFNVIYESGEFRKDYFSTQNSISDNTDPNGLAKSVRNFIKLFQCKFNLRKPCPGFHPLLYPVHDNSSNHDINPFAQYLRDGKPEGPWKYRIVEDKNISKKEILDISTNVGFALHIHCYYADMLPAIIEKINKNLCLPDLFISVSDNISSELVKNFVLKYKGRVISVDVCPNSGRDIGPLITQYSDYLIENYKYFGHFHTKKSLDNNSSAEVIDSWYSFLSSNLLWHENFNSIDNILHYLSLNKDVGIIFPDDPNCLGWCSNFKEAQKIAFNLGFQISNEPFVFPMGTMFWGKTEALKPLLLCNYKWNDYPQEPISNDGTMLHAIERLIPFIVKNTGFDFACTNIFGVTR